MLTTLLPLILKLRSIEEKYPAQKRKKVFGDPNFKINLTFL
jgi:hypothetical protein